MAPLSYSLLTDVLQYTPDTPAVMDAPVLPADKNNQVYQNTNIVAPNPNVVSRMIENFGNETTDSSSIQVRLMEEQVFLSKLILLLLGFMLIVTILEKK